jgi:uncharacterized cofD-like protein
MQLNKLNIVAIGGGHGLGRVLSTLSFMGNKLTGIVTTTDNGGSTGKLRKRSSSIAWGDLRNCLTELVDRDSIGSQLFNFRFDGNDELGGHNLGNLILYGLGEVQSRPLDSIKLVRRILGVKTQVFPMSEMPTDLMAFYHEGGCRVGELSVDEMPIMPQRLLLAPLVKSIEPCLKAINNADLIILGPGSFLTSIIPPLLVRDITNAIANRKGHCVFIDNVILENSPAAKLTLDEKLHWIEENIGCLPIDSAICQEKSAGSTKVKVISRDLTHHQQAHHHDKKKLIDALEECVSNLNSNTPTKTLATVKKKLA